MLHTSKVNSITTSLTEIALAFPRGAHQEALIDGVIQYATENDRRWSYLIAPESLSLSILDLRGWKGHGVIAALNTPAEAACARTLSLPVVNISSTLAKSSVPTVSIDNCLIGELAADHLINRGFQDFAYYGLKKVTYSKLRLEGFSKRLASVGFLCNTFLSPPTFRLHGVKWQEQHHALADWVGGLKTPVALFAVTDYRARQVLDACRQIGIRAPEQIAVLGVDNEEVICQHLVPTLSSVARDDLQEGYRAAALLDQLILGKKTDGNVSIPPLGVVKRESTGVLAVRDERIRNAIEYIIQHIEQPFDVDVIARHVGVSRRWLEYGFRKAVGESPYQYIRRQRLGHARHLLSKDRGMRIYEIARLTGFGSAKQFTVVFQQRYGMTPRGYRRSLSS